MIIRLLDLSPFPPFSSSRGIFVFYEGIFWVIDEIKVLVNAFQSQQFQKSTI
jgi:hypothetical protein